MHEENGILKMLTIYNTMLYRRVSRVVFTHACCRINALEREGREKEKEERETKNIHSLIFFVLIINFIFCFTN